MSGAGDRDLLEREVGAAIGRSIGPAFRNNPLASGLSRPARDALFGRVVSDLSAEVVSAIVEAAPMFVDKIGAPNLTSAEQRRDLQRLLAAIERAQRAAAALHPRLIRTLEDQTDDAGEANPHYCPIRLVLKAARDAVAGQIAVIPDSKPENITLHRIGKFISVLLRGLGVRVTRTDQHAYHQKPVQESPAVHVMRVTLTYYGIPAPALLRSYLTH